MPIPDNDLDIVSEEYQNEFRRFISDFYEENIDIDSNIDDIIYLIKKSNPEILLEQLAIAEESGRVISRISEEDEVGLPPRLIEYLLGLISVYGGNESYEPSFQEFGSLAQDLSEEIVIDKIKETGPNDSKEGFFRNQVELSALNRELTTGRFLFTRQYDIGARRAYKRYNSVLKHEFGFTIEEALKCSQYIQDQNTARWMGIYSQYDLNVQDLVSNTSRLKNRMKARQQGTDGFARQSESKKFLRDANHIDQFHEKINNDSNIFWMHKEDLYNDLPSNIRDETLNNFLDRMTLEVGEGDKYTKESFRYPFDFNPIHKRPLLEINNRIILPRPRTLMWTLVETFYYDLIDMDEGKFGDSFGKYVEEWVADEFSEVFTRKNVFLEPCCGYDSDEEVTDVLVTYDDTLFIIECKAGKLPINTRKGDFSVIEDEIDKKVGKGYNQVINTINEIQSGHLSEIVSRGKRIPVDGYESYQPLIIVGEPYDQLATTFAPDILGIQSDIPYITDVYNLQIITETLNSPDVLRDYIIGRREMLKGENKFMTSHEIDFLGMFIHYNNEFPDISDKVDKKHIMIADMIEEVCEEIDYKYGP